MFIGILATLLLLWILVGQFLESKKSGLLRLARDAYEERAIRYEGAVTYLRGPLDEFPEGTRVYLSVLDGVVCLTSPAKRMVALEGARVTAVEWGNPQQAVLTLQAEGREVRIGAHPQGVQMIQSTVE